MNDADKRKRDHRETLKLSDAVILFWGDADETWFRETLFELMKARCTARRNRPFAAEALYLSRPLRQEKAQYRSHLDLVVEQSGTFQPESLSAFVDRLRGNKKGAAV